MSDPSIPPPAPGPESRPSGSPDILKSPTGPSRNLPPVAWAVAGLIVAVVVAALIFAGRRHSRPSANVNLPLDPYAANLPITGAVMSESTSLSGGKSTYIDGHIQNTGAKTVTGATVQVFFRNDEGMPPHIETLALPLIRTREPYVDTQPISAAPLKPGDDREFRLIFETLPGNWNVQLPDIHLVRITTR